MAEVYTDVYTRSSWGEEGTEASRPLLSRTLLLKRLAGRHPGRPPGRAGARQESHAGEEQRRRPEQAGVGDAHSEEEAGQGAAEGQGRSQPQDDAQEGGPHPL